MDEGVGEYDCIQTTIHDSLVTTVNRKRGDTVYQIVTRRLNVLGDSSTLIKIEYVSEAECGKRYSCVFNPGTREVVINGCYGGFSLSTEAFDAFKALEGHKYDYDRDIPRDNVNLVRIVKELGAKANGSCAKLYVVEIPRDVDWIVCEYDGAEHIAERHRTWG